MSTSFLSGIQFAIEGFKLIFKPELRRFVVFPILLNILIFVLIFWLSCHYFSQFTLWLDAYLPHWARWLGSLIWLIFFLLFCLLVVYTFLTLANLVGAPFNSLLAEQVEEYLTGIKQPHPSLANTIINLPRMLGRQLGILYYFISRALLFLLLLLIPGIQLVAAPLFFLFNAWFIALQALDYPTDNHRIPLSDVKQQMKSHSLLVLGFGISLTVLSMIPIVNFFVIPAAVAGGTKLWLVELK